MSTSNVTIETIRATVDQLTAQLDQYITDDAVRSQIFARNMGAKGNLEAAESALSEITQTQESVDGMGIDIVTRVLEQKEKELDAIKKSLNSAKGIKEILEIIGCPFGIGN